MTCVRSPVKEWIEEGSGFLVYGGSKFKQELLQSHRRARLVRLMRDGGRAVEDGGGAAVAAGGEPHVIDDGPAAEREEAEPRAR